MGAPTNVKLNDHPEHGMLFEPVTGTNNVEAMLVIDETYTITASRFPGGGREATLNLTIDSDPTMDGDDGDENTRNDYDRTRFSGRFDGASGTFQCTGDECTIKHEGGDLYKIVAGTWTFTATNTRTAPVADNSYMYFGWWQREQKDNESFSFATFSGGQHQVDG